MHDDEVEPVAFLIALRRSRVRWLMIGRQALIHYGAPVQTMDYDLWVDPTARNLEKLLRLAQEHGLEAPDRVAIETRPWFSLFGGSLKIDVFKVRKFTNLDGETIDFASAFRRRVVARAEGDPLSIPLPAIRDLRTLKRMRDTAGDREDLRYLDEVAARRVRRKSR